MAYMIGQMRKEDNESYMTIENLDSTFIETANKFGGEPFYDFALMLKDTDFFNPNQIYYFRFAIKRIPYKYYSKKANPAEDLVTDDPDDSNDLYDTLFINSDNLDFTLLLANDSEYEIYTKGDDLINPPQEITTFTVESLSQSGYQIQQLGYYKDFVVIFSPIREGLNRLIFRLNRDAYDALIGGRNWLFGGEWTWPSDIENQKNTQIDKDPTDDKSGDKTHIYYNSEDNINSKSDFCILNNIIKNGNSWTKLGFQSRPGTQIVVNNQPMRVGRSGIYEIGNDNQKITSFRIAAPNGHINSQIDAFLLDYAYKV